ncbi:MAG TPA: dephospho-CoA kinase [Thermoanaerobaculia bacterium]|nr:dephospho-CoA kinase [Thermoanaerobaculia bacterium]
MILKVGLTGGIASGKSTVARMFAAEGASVIDADDLVRQLYRQGKAGYAVIVQNYGGAVLAENGQIDRAALSRIALATPEGANRLNALIHPLVIAEQQKLLQEKEREPDDSIAIVEATLLLESGGRERFDRIVVVDVPPEIQVQRGVARGMKREEVELRMSRQLNREQRLSAADYVVENSGNPDETRQQVEQLYATLVAELAAHGTEKSASE